MPTPNGREIGERAPITEALVAFGDTIVSALEQLEVNPSLRRQINVAMQQARQQAQLINRKLTALEELGDQLQTDPQSFSAIDLSDAIPAGVGTTGDPGDAVDASRGNHVHAQLKHALMGDSHTDTTSESPTKGQLVAGDGSDWDGHPVGADDTMLISDSAQPRGVRWTATVPTHGLMSASHDDVIVNTPTKGSMIVGDSSGPSQWSEHPIGGDGKLNVYLASQSRGLQIRYNDVVFQFPRVSGVEDGSLATSAAFQAVSKNIYLDEYITFNLKFSTVIAVVGLSGNRTLEWQVVDSSSNVIISGSGAITVGTPQISVCSTIAATNLPLTCPDWIRLETRLTVADAGSNFSIPADPCWRCY